MESSCRIQFKDHAKMSHVTLLHVTKIKLLRILPKTPFVIYFWKAYEKSSSMVMMKTSHVTCVTCHMSQMLHVTNMKLQIILPKTQYVIYFWKAHSKPSSVVMIKTSYVTYVTCHVSHILHVTCHTSYMSQISSWK